MRVDPKRSISVLTLIMKKVHDLNVFLIKTLGPIKPPTKAFMFQEISAKSVQIEWFDITSTHSPEKN